MITDEYNYRDGDRGFDNTVDHELKAEITCIMCSRVFRINDGEQDFFAQRGLSQPKRCPPCRAERKAEAAREGSSWEQRPVPPRRPTTYEVECRHCNRLTMVPFTPREGSEVYCRVCWEGVKNVGTGGAVYV